MAVIDAARHIMRLKNEVTTYEGKNGDKTCDCSTSYHIFWCISPGFFLIFFVGASYRMVRIIYSQNQIGCYGHTLCIEQASNDAPPRVTCCHAQPLHFIALIAIVAAHFTCVVAAFLTMMPHAKQSRQSYDVKFKLHAVEFPRKRLWQGFTRLG